MNKNNNAIDTKPYITGADRETNFRNVVSGTKSFAQNASLVDGSYNNLNVSKVVCGYILMIYIVDGMIKIMDKSDR